MKLDLDEVADRLQSANAGIANATTIKSKITEVGIFAVGLGILGIGLTYYWNRVAINPDGPSSTQMLAIALSPYVIVAAAGAATLVSRRKKTVVATLAVVTLAFLADAVLASNPIKWLISFGCIALVWKTGVAAIKEARPKDASK